MISAKEGMQKFRAKMYEAGFKQKIIWVKRDESKNTHSRFERNEFMRRIDELTAGLSKSKTKKLYNEVIKFIESKEEISKK